MNRSSDRVPPTAPTADTPPRTRKSAGRGGDQRRAALLLALDERLREHAVDDIDIADITTAAGVSRSAFYKYFTDKAAAIAALGTEMFGEMISASSMLIDGEGSARDRIDGSIRRVFAAWDDHRHLFPAILSARQRNPAVRASWDAMRMSFVTPLAALIDAERLSGAAPSGAPDSEALAIVLLELNERVIEQHCLDRSVVAGEQRIEALITLWLRAIHGHVPE